MEQRTQTTTIPYIIGDGIGSDIWKGARRVFDAAVQTTYSGKRTINWIELFAGEKAFQQTGSYLPAETIQSLEDHKVGIKGPLTTPVGGGYTSLNVSLRKQLDLYTCMRPIRWFHGLPSPIKDPKGIDLVVFRENTEDIYAGIEFPPETQANKDLLTFLKNEHNEEFRKLRFEHQVGLDIKPISKAASERITRAALQWAVEKKRKRVTIVHKGNIMKYTEGFFRACAYDLAESGFSDTCFTLRQYQIIAQQNGLEAAASKKEEALANGKIFVDDLIADNAFARAIIKPTSFDVVVTTNLNGDYLSDAFAALIGGVGISPGANINQEKGIGLFEANHGSAVDIAGQNKANPSSLILSGVMMFQFLGWDEAASTIQRAIEKTIQDNHLTFDLYTDKKGQELVGTAQFCDHIIKNIQSDRS